jgi:hypothetical protein
MPNQIAPRCRFTGYVVLPAAQDLLIRAKHLFIAASRDAMQELCPGPQTPLLMVWKCTDGQTRRCGFAMHSLTQRR